MTHTATPDSPNWWTNSHGGAWRTGCTGCDRVIEMGFSRKRDGTYNGYWRHVRRTPAQMTAERETRALARALGR